MKIETKRVGDVVVFEIEGAFTPKERPRPMLEELVEEQLGGGERKFLIDMRRATQPIYWSHDLGSYLRHIRGQMWVNLDKCKQIGLGPESGLNR